MSGRLRNIALLCVVAGFFGCEWDSTDDSRSSNSNVGVNVSGAYRDAGGSFLVQTSGPNASQTTTKVIGTGTGTVLTFGGSLSANPVARGTVSVTDGVETWSDVDGNGAMSSSIATATGKGTVDYAAGTVSVTFSAAVKTGVSVLATFSFFGPGTTENPQSGKSGQPIFLFTVRQNGNRMDIVDDRGDSYVGRIEDPFTDFEKTETDPNATAVTDTSATADTGTGSGGSAISKEVGLSYPFEVSGTSSGNPIRIVGTIKAEVTTFFAPSSETTTGNATATTSTSVEEVFQRTSFRMIASWIETSTGKAASIDAVGPSDEGATIINPGLGAIN